MKILLINQDWFAAEWRAQGHEVVVASASPEHDIQFSAPLVTLESLCARFKPDRIIVHDNSAPVMVVGLEDTSIPTVFYSVDAHHHTHYHKYLAGTFDLTYVAQRDYLPEFLAHGGASEWLPLWASRVVEASAEKRFGAVFVGTMDPKLNPDRVSFFSQLKTRVALTIERGEYWKIFPQAEIVINQTVKGDLNFRVFEAMMCGAMLLTEGSGNGLEDIFTPGTHLVTYQKGSVDGAAASIAEYLADLPRCRAIAARGRAEIMAKHQPTHRAATVMQRLETLVKRDSDLHYFGMASNYSIAAALFETVSRDVAAMAQLQAIRCIELGLLRRERMTYELSCHMVYTIMRSDQQLGERRGADLIRRLMASYPTDVLFRFSAIREHLNYGEQAQAHELAAVFTGSSVDETYATAEKLMSELLAARKK